MLFLILVRVHDLHFTRLTQISRQIYPILILPNKYELSPYSKLFSQSLLLPYTLILLPELRLKIDLVSYPARAEGLVNSTLYPYSKPKKKHTPVYLAHEINCYRLTHTYLPRFPSPFIINLCSYYQSNAYFSKKKKKKTLLYSTH